MSDDLVPVLQAGVREAKELQAACLAHGLRAELGKDDECAEGCSPKVFLLVREVDVTAVQELLHRRWMALAATVDREIDPAGLGVEVADGEPPCPACGARAALVEGACPECGLQLA